MQSRFSDMTCDVMERMPLHNVYISSKDTPSCISSIALFGKYTCFITNMNDWSFTKIRVYSVHRTPLQEIECVNIPRMRRNHLHVNIHPNKKHKKTFTLTSLTAVRLAMTTHLYSYRVVSSARWVNHLSVRVREIAIEPSGTNVH